MPIIIITVGSSVPTLSEEMFMRNGVPLFVRKGKIVIDPPLNLYLSPLGFSSLKREVPYLNNFSFNEYYSLPTRFVNELEAVCDRIIEPESKVHEKIMQFKKSVDYVVEKCPYPTILIKEETFGALRAGL